MIKTARLIVMTLALGVCTALFAQDQVYHPDDKILADFYGIDIFWYRGYDAQTALARTPVPDDSRIFEKAREEGKLVYAIFSGGPGCPACTKLMYVQCKFAEPKALLEKYYIPWHCPVNTTTGSEVGTLYGNGGETPISFVINPGETEACTPRTVGENTYSERYVRLTTKKLGAYGRWQGVRDLLQNTLVHARPGAVDGLVAVGGNQQAIVSWEIPNDYRYKKVVVLRSSSSITTETLVDDTDYTVGTVVDGAEVVYVGEGTTFTETGLTSSATYYYKAFSISKTALAGSGIETNVTIPAATPEISIEGNNTEIVSGDTDPSTTDDTDFGSVLMNDSVTHTFTIFNTGIVDLVLDGNPLVDIDNPAFTLSADPVTPISPSPGNTTFDITFTSGVSGSQSATISIANNDADESSYVFKVTAEAVEQSILTDMTSVDVLEGETATFKVRLNVKPTTPVTVTVSRTDGDDSITVDGSTVSLTFDDTNWSQYQDVILVAAEDADLTNGSATISLESDGLTAVTVTATESDNDTPGFTLSKTAVTVAENGGEATFTVVLTTQPASDVVFTITSNDSNEAIVSPDTLTFSNTTWNSPQDITVTGVNDQAVGADSAVVSIAVDATASDDDFDTLATQTVDVSCTDNDHSVTFETDGTPGVTQVIEIVEDGGSCTFTAIVPAGFTFAGWTGDVTSSDNPLTISNVAANMTIMANYTENVVVIETSHSSVSVTEGATVIFQVRLSAQPTGSVTINVNRTAGDESITVSDGAVLIFSTTNWQTDQPVTISADDDADTTDDSATITCSATAAGFTSVDVTVTESDDDEPSTGGGSSGGGCAIGAMQSNTDMLIVFIALLSMITVSRLMKKEV